MGKLRREKGRKGEREIGLMREENANAVETGRDRWRRAGRTDGLVEKERRGSGVGATFFLAGLEFFSMTLTEMDLH